MREPPKRGKLYCARCLDATRSCPRRAQHESAATSCSASIDAPYQILHTQLLAAAGQCHTFGSRLPRTVTSEPRQHAAVQQNQRTCRTTLRMAQPSKSNCAPSLGYCTSSAGSATVGKMVRQSCREQA